MRQVSETRDRLHMSSGRQSSGVRLGTAFYFEAQQNDSNLKSDWADIVSCNSLQNIDSELVENLLFYSKLALSAYAKTPEDAYLRSGIPSEYIVLSQYNSSATMPAYVVYYKDCTAYICVRGTQQFEDVLTVLECDSDPLLHGKGHKGIVRGAKNLLLTILPTLESLKPTKTFVAGHSLGGAAAAVLVLLLREHGGIFQNTEGYAFCPPPVIDAELMPTAMDCVISVVHGQDLVPSLDANAVDKLLIFLSNQEWETEAASYLKNRTKGHVRRRFVEKTGSSLASSGSSLVNRYENSSHRAVSKGSSGEIPDNFTQLFLPGRIFHLMHGRATTPGLFEREACDFSIIKPSLFGLNDHKIENVRDSLLQIRETLSNSFSTP
eukprot:CAMPEP_0182452390 /NCGR_PEP_ID=MMETSP1172-20130603/44222_1 /TAXON_ID=708627 /ORGANISM="Timspurckia oligopyrenoides, Strain CCMP3278" /LENGTH=378 /DNA_ID=CAMNT_0024650219 /DNA_START=315 /DNA_END=1451 /DNA_ORIENTATION=-